MKQDFICYNKLFSWEWNNCYYTLLTQEEDEYAVIEFPMTDSYKKWTFE